MSVCELHTPAGPVRPEPARFDAREPNVPFGFHLQADGLGEALDRPFAGTVNTEERHAPLTPYAGDLLDQPARGGLTVPHDPHGFPGDVDQAEEIDLHLPSDLTVGVGFEATGQAVPGVVDDDVDPAELGQGRGEGRPDALRVGHVESEGEVVVWGGVL